MAFIALGSGLLVWAVFPKAKPSDTETGEQKTQLAHKTPAEKPQPHPKDTAKPDEVRPHPSDAQSQAQATVTAIFASINLERKADNLPPLRLEQSVSLGCQEHARWLMQHWPTHADLDPHSQDPSLTGGTPAGAATAPHAHIVKKAPADALRAWLANPGHRSFLMDPQLESFGFAFAKDEAGNALSVFDWSRGRKPTVNIKDEPIAWPVPNQANVPLLFPGNEVPDPLPMTKQKIAGYPITVTFPPRVKVPDARAWFENEAGETIDVWFSSPTKPANEEFPRNQQNTVCLFPKKTLEPGTRYLVRVEATIANKPWSRTWTFTTQSPKVFSVHIYQRALDRINLLRNAANVGPLQLDPELMAGCQEHAQYLARHLDRTAGFEVNAQDPMLELSTPRGAALAKTAILRLGGGTSPRDAVDWIADSVMNRHALLNPSASTIGLAAALHLPRGWVWVISIPTIRRQGDALVTLYPGEDQKDVPRYLGREITTLVPDRRKDEFAGFGISANFFPRHKLTKVQARLNDADGAEVPCWISSPEKQLPGTGSYRQILLVPKSPLANAAKYTATMNANVDGKPWSQTWSFTTIDEKAVTKRMAEEIVAQINDVRKLAGLAAVTLDAKLSDGCQKHAKYVQHNLEHPKVQGLGIHDEDPKLKYATPEGAKAGTAGVIALISDPADSLGGWMATLYHRLPFLDPQLKRVGYGQERHPLRGWVTVLDVGSGK
jgi:uncharacterized protein YkwD